MGSPRPPQRQPQPSCKHRPLQGLPEHIASIFGNGHRHRFRLQRGSNFNRRPGELRRVNALPSQVSRRPVSRRQVSRHGLGLTVVTLQLVRQGQDVQVLVRDNNVDQALRALKKKLQREGVFREMKLRDHYEKPSEKRAREKAEAVRRARKVARKRAQRDGLLPVKPKPVR